MSSSTKRHQHAAGKGRGRQGQGQSRNRRSRGGGRRGGGGGRRQGGGARSGGVDFSKMPRAKPKPSLWKRFLALLGLGGSTQKAKTKAKPKANVQRCKSTSTHSAKQSQGKVRTTVSKSPKKRATRTPKVVAVTSPRLYVGNLSYDATESDLQELFNGVGTVMHAEVVYHGRTQRSKGFAFVEMGNQDEAQRAVTELHDKDYMGRKLVVSGAKPPKAEAASSS